MKPSLVTILFSLLLTACGLAEKDVTADYFPEAGERYTSIWDYRRQREQLTMVTEGDGELVYYSVFPNTTEFVEYSLDMIEVGKLEGHSIVRFDYDIYGQESLKAQKLSNYLHLNTFEQSLEQNETFVFVGIDYNTDQNAGFLLVLLTEENKTEVETILSRIEEIKDFSKGNEVLEMINDQGGYIFQFND